MAFASLPLFVVLLVFLSMCIIGWKVGGGLKEMFSVEGCGAVTSGGSAKIRKIEEMLDSVVPGLTGRIGICEADRSYTLNKMDIRLRVKK